MRALSSKLVRDLTRMWSQTVPVMLITALGAAIFIISSGLLRSLEETQTAYYERYRFADVFATAKRAPVTLERELARIPGVKAASTGIAYSTLLDISGMADPVNGLLVSQPEPEAINQIHIRVGRRVSPRSEAEVVLSEAFAQANGMHPGDAFYATFKGQRRQLKVVGIALSPEYVFFSIPGSIVPDDRRGGVLWMDRTALGSIFDLDRSFNHVGLQLMPGAQLIEVLRRTDDILRPYGGVGAFGRSDHISSATLNAEMRQLRSTVLFATPTFIGIIAFLLHMVMSRHVQTERERIGTLKAFGYSNFQIAWHYCCFVIAIISAGLIIGVVGSMRLGYSVTQSYAARFHFPFLVYELKMNVLVQVTVILLGAGFLGAIWSVWRAARLAPAVAMRSPPPPIYENTLIERLLSPLMDPLTRMIVRHIARWPKRSLATIAGLAVAMGMVVAPVNVVGSAQQMIDTHFFRAARETVTIAFAQQQPWRVVEEAMHWPGVISAEPFRSANARVSFRGKNHRVLIMGSSPTNELSRPLNGKLDGLTIPPAGLVVSETMARWLGVRSGDILDVQFTDFNLPMKRVPVVSISTSYVGITFFIMYMEQATLSRLLDESPFLNGLHLRVDLNKIEELQKKLKQTPQIFGASFSSSSLRSMRVGMDDAMGLTWLNVLLALLIVLGVVYNTVRISLTERRRELASMCLIGYSRAAAWYVVIGDVVLLTLAAIPLGCVVGYGFSFMLTEGASNEIFRVPLWFERWSLGLATLVVLGALSISALFVGRAIKQLDLVSAMKTMD